MGAHQSLGQCFRGLWDLLAVGLCHARILETARLLTTTLSLCGVAFRPKFAPFGGREQLWSWRGWQQDAMCLLVVLGAVGSEHGPAALTLWL